MRDELKEELVRRGLSVVGFVTHGEWNSIRTQSSTRPVSVIQLMANARKTAKKTRVNLIKKYLSLSPLNQKPLKDHPAIPIQDLQMLQELCKDGKPIEEAIFIFYRARCFPFQYDPYLWESGDLAIPLLVSKPSVLNICIYTTLNSIVDKEWISSTADIFLKNVQQQKNIYTKERIMVIY